MAGQGSQLSKAEATTKAKGAGCHISQKPASGAGGAETAMGKNETYKQKK